MGSFCLFVILSALSFHQVAATNNEWCILKPQWEKINPHEYGKALINWLLKNEKNCTDYENDYQSFDGTHHNLGKPDLGSTGQHILRGWSGMSINEFYANLWLPAWNEAKANVSMCRDNANNALLLFFSKQVAFEILNTEHPHCTETNGFNFPRHELNYATPYIDGGIIYGTSWESIKQYVTKKGTISFDHGLFKNTDAILTVLRTIWLKLHNLLAEELGNKCSKWSSVKIFNEARKYNIAIQQSIYVYEWFHDWTGDMIESNGSYRYDPFVDPQVEKLFQVAEYLPQSLIEPGFVGHANLNLSSERTGSDYPRYLPNIIESLIADKCNSHENYREITNMELKNGLPNINHALKVSGSSFYTNWTTFSDSNNVANSSTLFKLIDNNLNHMDSMLGGTLESRKGPGKLFSKVIHDQFRRTRDGDRFWFENKHNKSGKQKSWVPNINAINRGDTIIAKPLSKYKDNDAVQNVTSLFSDDEICRIRKISFADVVLAVTNISNEHFANTAFKCTTCNMFSNNSTWRLNEDKNYPKDNTKSANIFIRYEVILNLVIMGYCLAIVAVAMCVIIWKKRHLKLHGFEENRIILKSFQEKTGIRSTMFLVQEYGGVNKLKRRIIVVLNEKPKKQILVYFTCGTIWRDIWFEENSTGLQLITIKNKRTIILKCPRTYDLVLQFQSTYLLNSFVSKLGAFMTVAFKDQMPTVTQLTWRTAESQILTRQRHQILLEMFFRVAFAQAFQIEHSLEEMLDVDTTLATEVVYTELSIVEFAECLSMHQEHDFVKIMFSLVDGDVRSRICFRTFLDLFIVFANATEEKKIQLLFKLYDIDGTEVLTAADFKAMLNSFLELTGECTQSNLSARLLEQHGLHHKKKLEFRDFKKLAGCKLRSFSHATLNESLPNNHSYLSLASSKLMSMYSSQDSKTVEQPKNRKPSDAVDKELENATRYFKKISTLQKSLLFCDGYFKRLFWFMLIIVFISWMVFHKAYYFYSTTKLMGINRYVIAISKASSYGIVLTYSVLFISMCRNFSTSLKETIFNTFLPIDSFTEIHHCMGYASAIFTLIHAAGQAYIFASFSQITFKTGCKVEFIDDEIKHIIDLKWKNPVSISGALLLLLAAPFYVFAQAALRRKLYTLFYFAHHLYPFIIILLIIHGSLSQWSLVYFVLSGPIIIYFLDSLIGLNKRKIKMSVLRIEHLPSNVICLILKHPTCFQYEVGQWIRLAIDPKNPREFHRFVLASTPYERVLRIYVEPSEPCAHQLRTLADMHGTDCKTAQIGVRIDGPYGNGVKEWRFHEVVILIGGGRNVAVFASVLKDIAFVLKNKLEVPCRKVYFIWTSKTQKHFEWIVDLIREVEDIGTRQSFSAHIFITERYEKFDLRTTMLMICEKHYRRISDRSILTGLKAVTHFERPDVSKFFEIVQTLHETVEIVGVFSSGPLSLKHAVDASCNQINRFGGQRFEHRFV